MTVVIRNRAALAVTLALCGCRETTPSDYVPTRRIAALVDVTADSAESATVRAELHADGADSGTYVVLDSGDELIATADGKTRALERVGEGVYEATFGTGEAMELTVSFNRAKHMDAPASKATLPPPFTLASPKAGEELSRAEDDLVIAWSPLGTVKGRVELEGSCIAPLSRAIGEGMTDLVLEAGEVEPAGEQDADDACEVELVVTFSQEGSADPALDEESRMTAHQVRKVLFTSAP